MTTNKDCAAEVIDRWTKQGGELNSAVGSPHELAEYLAAAGLIMSDLPEPTRRNHRDEPIWETEGRSEVSNTGRLPVNLTGPFGKGWSMHPIEARKLAYALLAAANHAEKDSDV